MLGQHCFKHWSGTQAIIALSSGEAEYYGVVKAASTSMGCRAMFKDMGIKMKINIYTDAEAAKGIASRTGLGKTRHIAVHYLWVQDALRRDEFKLFKVKGENNPADLLTKHVTSERLKDMLTHFRGFHTQGRSAVTPAT